MADDAQPTGEDLQVRYERVRLHLVPQFLDRYGMTVSALARLIDVERSSLGRFLHAVPGYEPTRDRQGKLEMLERLDALCSGHHLRLEMERELVTPRGPDAEPETDFDVMLRHFNERVVGLGERYEPALALSMLAEFFGYAVGPPPESRASMCASLLRVVAQLVEHPGIADVSDSLLRATTEQVRRLEAGALDVAPKEPGKAAPHPSSSAGHALALLGLRLADDALIEDGLERLERAASELCESDDEAPWASLLEILETLLQRGHREAGTWSERVVSRFTRTPPAGLAAILRGRSFPHVRPHWTDIAPGLMRRIDSHADGVRTGTTS